MENIMDRTGLSREMIIAIALGALIFLGGVFAIALLLVFDPGQNNAGAVSAPALDYEVLTAREAYVPAVEVIRQQDAGAELASGIGAWTPTINTSYLIAGRTGWTFHFYLPASGEMATVVVDRGSTAWIAERVAWETPPDLLDDQNWQVDSAQAVDQFYQVCGVPLESESPEDNMVQARLSTASSNGGLIWQIAAVSLSTELPICGVTVDATTGSVR